LVASDKSSDALESMFLPAHDGDVAAKIMHAVAETKTIDILLSDKPAHGRIFCSCSNVVRQHRQ
jgi:hypothetical protein